MTHLLFKAVSICTAIKETLFRLQTGIIWCPQKAQSSSTWRKRLLLTAGMRGELPFSYMGHLIAKTWALTPPGLLLVVTGLFFIFNFLRFYLFSLRRQLVKKKDFIYFTFRERGKEGEREGEKQQCARDTAISCLSHNPNWGPVPQPRHVPWLGIKLATFSSFWFTGRHSIHWTTPARVIVIFNTVYMAIIRIYLQNDHAV